MPRGGGAAGAGPRQATAVRAGRARINKISTAYRYPYGRDTRVEHSTSVLDRGKIEVFPSAVYGGLPP